MKRSLLYLLVTAALCGAVFLFGGWQKPAPQQIIPHKNLVASYFHDRDSINTKRKALYSKYVNSKTTAQKEAILHQARSVFLSGITQKLFPYWYGTPWEFYGYGDTPRVNAVACGYFVAILLRDAGAKVNVYNLAEGTSGAMIQKLVSKEYIKKYRETEATAFFNSVKTEGDGLYIVGLDQHTGFLSCENGKLYFIDSAPNDVQRHDPFDSYWLVSSHFRMTGKVSDDPQFLRKWLGGVGF